MEKNSCKFTDKKGFTLVELVIVIVIVGILSTISVSAYSSLALKAVEAEGASLVNFIAKNEVTYQIENGIFLNIPNDVEQSDALGVNLNISKYFQTFKAVVSTDDEGEPFVFIVIKGTYKGDNITLSFGRSVSGYNSGILKGDESNDENLAKLKCKQHRYRHRYGNNGNGNDNGNGTGNGKGNNGNANGQDNGNNGNDNGNNGNGNDGNNGKDNGGNGNNDKKDDPDDDKSQGQGNGNKD
ncbi:hypothetical protein MASR1M68_04760 [Elusimicrobiota bacterium]